jgi:Swt1-like HEPN
MSLKHKENIVKLFGITNQFTEFDLDRVEKEFKIDLGRKKQKTDKDNIYYPQFELEVRKEAKEMAKHYEIFYCLEKSIRDLISTTLEASGEPWWNDKVPQNVKEEVKKRIQREKDSGVTVRSEEPIDFTTFGELGEIIKSNWVIFQTIFNSIKAVENVMSQLNTLRGPIAHCSKLAEDEVLRLQITVRAWFRLME